MSIYISLKTATLFQKPSKDICVLIQSKSARLATPSVPKNKQLDFYDSFVCSPKQQQIDFYVVHSDDTMIIGRTSLHFASSGILHSSGAVLTHGLQLKDQAGRQAGRLDVDIEYDKKKNYLGEIQFYEIKGQNIAQNAQHKSTSQRLAPAFSDKHNFPLYLGSCKSKNMFSCCDQSTSSQIFTWVQDSYKK